MTEDDPTGDDGEDRPDRADPFAIPMNPASIELWKRVVQEWNDDLDVQEIMES
jgi:hypothetical protein